MRSTGKTFVYARVSTAEQNLDSQVEILRSAYPEGILYTEKRSGTNTTRPELNAALKAIGAGDRLVVWKLDRLARSMRHLLDVVDKLESVGASLVIHDQRIDTSTAAGKAFLQMLGVFAEFETNLRRERQLAGIQAARREDAKNGTNRYKGKQINKDKHSLIEKYLLQGYKAPDVIKLAESSRTTVFRVKKGLQDAGKI